jgi:peptidoglycan/LPS O-acetylase OafA/YrhL
LGLLGAVAWPSATLLDRPQQPAVRSRGETRIPGRIDGIQWLRAVMSVFVVIWHLGGGGKSSIFSTQDFERHLFTTSDFVNFNILLLAVPTFMIASNYLLAAADRKIETLFRRMKRVAVLLAFWPIASLLFRGCWAGLVEGMPASLAAWPAYVLTAGNTIFYFFVSLLVTYAATFWASGLSTRANLGLLGASALAVGAAPLVAPVFDAPFLCAYWSPANFLPYSFVAVIAARSLRRLEAGHIRVLLPALLLLCGALSLLEWRLYPNAVFFRAENLGMPAYTRPSLIAFATALLILAVRWNPPTSVAVDFMARHSLALYCLHIFVAAPAMLILAKSGMNVSTLPVIWLAIALTVPGSYVTAILLSRIWRPQLLY